MMEKERNAFTNSVIIVDRYKTFVKSGQPCIYCGSIDTGNVNNLSPWRDI